MKSIVIFGAGNIGRSFIGNIFSANQWKVIFIDANKQLVEKLNNRGSYPVILKRNNQTDERKEIIGISALHSSENKQILEALINCSVCATAVGQNALPFVIPYIASAVKSRAAENKLPLDIIIAENIRNGADYFRNIFRENGLHGDEAGLAETSIGKMVPIMSAAELAADPLVLHAEEYNTLILDRKGFKSGSPAFPEIKAVDNIAAWVDRKLFIHNLGHAATAYLGFAEHPELSLIADVIEIPEIRARVKTVMSEAAEALLIEYPNDFTRAELIDHIDDLLFRFSNKALGDTVFRVGRDLFRKLSRNDRICGAAALCMKHNLPCTAAAELFRAALKFKAADDNGKMLENDSEFHRLLTSTDSKDRLFNRLSFDAAADKTLIKLLSDCQQDYIF